MSFIVAAQTVWTQAFVEGATDTRGNPVDAWADEVPQLTYGWDVPKSIEPKRAGAQRVIVDLELLVPDTFRVGPYDKVRIPGRPVFDVLGEAEDYNNGPFDWAPGFVVNLGRVDG
ncbi:hypothetical protein [Rhodococcus erythropolis]|uniref:hypothetical protein n=1 Tax=Rhodococcus erythropolis TaxID=1833 RepID=UPI001BEB5E7A|nr:hypothetical protein [Rhodococcus erythropolis]MBT2266451.1 hypothetical protein [Rhodococcus erythropolis]